MGVFAYIKNGTKYKMNQFPGAYPASRVSYNGSDVEAALNGLNADIIVVNDTVNLGDISGNGYTSKPLTIPNGYEIKAVCCAPSSTSVTAGRLIVNGDFSGNTVYITYYSTIAFQSASTNVVIRAICKKV